MEQYLQQSRNNRLPGGLLEERSNEKSQRATPRIEKTYKIGSSIFIKRIRGDECSIGAVQTNFSRALENNAVWVENSILNWVIKKRFLHTIKKLKIGYQKLMILIYLIYLIVKK